MGKRCRSLVWLAIGIVLFLLLFHGIENWRGHRAWERWKRSREAMGDSYDWNAFVPRAVPDAENFAAAPLVAKAVGVKGSENLLGEFQIPEDPALSGTWREGQHVALSAWASTLHIQDFDTYLRPVAKDLDELALASRRQHCRFPVKYECAELPGLMGFKRAARVLRLRALLRLSQGRVSEAREDTLTILHMARHLNDEPTLIGSFLQMALVELALQPVWEGLVDNVWQEQDLAQLQEVIGSVDVLRVLFRAWRQERLSVSDFSGTTLGEFAEAPGWERARNLSKMLMGGENPKPGALRTFAIWCLVPRGWVYQNMVNQDWIWAEGLEPCLDPHQHRVFPDRSERFREELNSFKKIGRMSPYRFLAVCSIPAMDFHSVLLRAASRQASLDQAATACALERHRLARGRYPGSLNALLPGWIAALPHDVVGGGPLRYALNEDGTYFLYSIGANGLDDGGTMALRQEGPPRQALEKGDWPWPKSSAVGSGHPTSKRKK